MTYSLQGECILLYGPPKVGKTKLASSFPRPLFITTERGHNYLPEGQKKIKIDLTCVEDVNKINLPSIHKKCNIQTVVFDTVNLLHKMCKLEVCTKKNCFHPSDKGEFSRAIWDYINDLFIHHVSNISNQVASIGATFILIDHAKEEQVEIGAMELTKVTFNMSGQARKIIEAMPDHIWYMGYGTPESQDPKASISRWIDDRMLVIRGGELLEAGTRDDKLKIKSICPLKEPDRENKTGGYWQIIQELEKNR